MSGWIFVLAIAAYLAGSAAMQALIIRLDRYDLSTPEFLAAVALWPVTMAVMLVGVTLRALWKLGRGA